MSAINPKVNSLLNYRFVKKTVPKLPGGASSSDSENSQSSQTSGTPLQSSHSINSDHQNYTKTLSQDSDATILDSQATILYNDSQRDENFPDSQETIILSDGRKTPTINSVGNPDTVPETPQSGLTSPTSPVFRARSKGSRQLTVIDDSEESQEPTSSTASSPWMSKENGIITNGVSSTTAGKQRRKERQVVREEFETADDGMVNGDNTQDMDNKVQQLRAMFPSQLKTTISVALTESNGDLEKAIDLLIDGRVFLSKPKTKKRVIRHESSDSELDSSPIRKPAKRKRMISDEVTENDAQHTSHPEEAKIQYILEIFPQKSRRDISRALESNDWDTSKATLELTNENGKPQEVLGDDDKDFDSDEGADSDDSYEELQQESSNNTTVLSFFNDATREELTNTPGCSKKKAELIMTLRPFSDYRSMVDVFADNKTLGMDVIRGCMEIIRVRDVVVKLMQRCERISKDMETRVTVLTKRPDLEDEEDSDCIKIKQQPKYLSEKFQLKPFQMVGLNWLRLMHAQEVNGILADEMGLGKTIQTIAFIAHLLEEGEEGPHVVIVPSSTIENWMREFHDWCPSIDVLVYYGSQEERKLNRQNIFYNGKNDFHVILTTYNMATGSIEDRSLFKKIDFHYAIFDEGHMLKNMSSLRYQNLTKINAERRLLLTGTPLQNNLLELMSLLSFVMPDIFMGKADQLKRMFSMISKGTDDRSRFESERIMHAKRIMKPFVLRRLKSEVQKQLPRKTEQVEYCPLNPGQQEIYDKLVKKFSEAIADESIQNSRGASMLMQLRKAANHPLLIRHHFNDNVLRTMAKKIAKEPSHLERGALPDLIYQDMEEMNDSDLMRLCDQYKKYIGHLKPDLSVIGDSGKFRRLKELLEFHKSKGDRVLIFSQFTMLMDIMEQYLQQLKYSYLRMDGSTPVPDRQEMIDKYTNDESIFLFMLSTRAGGLGINLIAANVVIIHDIDFNPYNDKQAEDRCHRVGQKREVKIIRMISKGTVEEGMLRCARDKLRLEKDVTTGEEFDKENSADVASLLKDALLEKKV